MYTLKRIDTNNMMELNALISQEQLSPAYLSEIYDIAYDRIVFGDGDIKESIWILQERGENYAIELDNENGMLADIKVLRKLAHDVLQAIQHLSNAGINYDDVSLRNIMVTMGSKSDDIIFRIPSLTSATIAAQPSNSLFEFYTKIKKGSKNFEAVSKLILILEELFKKHYEDMKQDEFARFIQKANEMIEEGNIEIETLLTQPFFTKQNLHIKSIKTGLVVENPAKNVLPVEQLQSSHDKAKILTDQHFTSSQEAITRHADQESILIDGSAENSQESFVKKQEENKLKDQGRNTTFENPTISSTPIEGDLTSTAYFYILSAVILSLIAGMVVLFYKRKEIRKFLLSKQKKGKKFVKFLKSKLRSFFKLKKEENSRCFPFFVKSP